MSLLCPHVHARWLHVGVRPGASSEAFTPLASRQELTPTPNAIYSQSAETADAATTAATATTAASVPWTGLTGVPAGFADDVDNDSGGTVTSVATGSGLTGGPVTTAGTVSIADGGVTSGMIAAGAVGSMQVNNAEVQARITGTCPEGSSVQAVGSDGTVVCRTFPQVRFWTATRTNTLGCYNELSPTELSSAFRVVIDKQAASSLLRITLNENIGNNGTGCGAWIAVQVRMDGNPISNPANCIYNNYSNYDYQFMQLNYTCFARNVSSGAHTFSVWYACTSACGNDCIFGNSWTWMGGAAANATLSVEELY